MRCGTVIFALIVYAAGFFPGVASAQNIATGVVRTDEAVIVRSEVAGIIRIIEVREGQAVVEGDVLVQLRSDLQEIGVRLADARLARAEAAGLASRVTLENAQDTLARVEIAASALTVKEHADVSDEVERLEALLRAQEAEVDEARVALDLRRNDLDETRILAPFDGTVTITRVRRGDTVEPLVTPILDLVNLDQLYFELALPVDEIPNVREGSSVEVRVENIVLGAAGIVAGVVAYVNPTVDPSSRTFLVKIEISDPSRTIRPGMRAEVQFR